MILFNCDFNKNPLYSGIYGLVKNKSSILFPRVDFTSNDIYTNPFQFLRDLYEGNTIEKDLEKHIKTQTKYLDFFKHIWIPALREIDKYDHPLKEITYGYIDPHYDDIKQSDVIKLYSYLLKCYDSAFQSEGCCKTIFIELANNYYVKHIINYILNSSIPSSPFDFNCPPKGFNGIRNHLESSDSKTNKKILEEFNKISIHFNRSFERATSLFEKTDSDDIKEIINLGESLISIMGSLYIAGLKVQPNDIKTHEKNLDKILEISYKSSHDTTVDLCTDIKYSALSISNERGGFSISEYMKKVRLFLKKLYELSFVIYYGYIPMIKILDIWSIEQDSLTQMINLAKNKLYRVIDIYIDFILIFTSYYRLSCNYTKGQTLQRFIENTGNKFKEVIDMFIPFMNENQQYDFTLKESSIFYNTHLKTRIIVPIIDYINKKYKIFLYKGPSNLYNSIITNGKLIYLLERNPETLKRAIMEWYIDTTLNNVARLASPNGKIRTT